MLKFLTMLSVFGLLASLAQAKLILPPGSHPTVALVGNELQVTYAPDKVAYLAIRENKVSQVAAKLKLKNTSCFEQTPAVQCEIHNWIKSYELRLLWKTHPDAARVGKMLENVSSSSIQFDEWSQRFQKNLGKATPISGLAQGMPNPRIQCSDYNWVPKGLSSIQEVSFESMVTSTETGLTENRTELTYQNVELTIDQNGIQWTKIRPYNQSTSANFKRFNGVAAPLMGWTIADENGETCEYYFERELPANLTSLLLDFNDFKTFPVTSLEKLNEQLLDQKFASLSGNYGRESMAQLKDSPLDIQLLIGLRLADFGLSIGADGAYTDSTLNISEPK
jgi:hypothetical protein